MPFLMSVLYRAPGSGEYLRAHCTELGSVPFSFRTPVVTLSLLRQNICGKEETQNENFGFTHKVYSLYIFCGISFPLPLVAAGYQTICSMLIESLLSSVLLPPGSAFPFHLPHLIFSFLPLLLRVIDLPILYSLPVYSKQNIYPKQFSASGLQRCHRKCCLRSRDQISTL